MTRNFAQFAHLKRVYDSSLMWQYKKLAGFSIGSSLTSSKRASSYKFSKANLNRLMNFEYPP